MLQQHLKQVWEQLRSKKAHLPYFLEEARIQGLRGMDDLTVRFHYPVSVLAGPNACGKSTVLFALACAYKVPGSGIKDFVPSTMFPDFKSGAHPSDQLGEAALKFYYIHGGERYRMRWSRGKQWNRSYLGLKQGKQPERATYLRTLANLSNPSEVRSVLQLGRRPELEREEITSDLLIFAQRVLPFRYRQLFLMGHKGRDVLFARRNDGSGPSYSEFHMSAGERAILKLSKDITREQDAMILIDEVEAGMHPFTQQQLMLELQRLALRNGLQIVVTTHSEVVLDTVPPEARLFLERTDDQVVVLPPYRDLIQKSLYGRSVDKFSILCEDKVAESLLRGVLDVLNRRLNLSPSDIELGRDTGKAEFPQHVRALAKFKRLADFIFVLDGDARQLEAKLRQAAADCGQPIRLAFLPGEGSPEMWVWEQFRKHVSEYSEALGLDAVVLARHLDDFERAFAGAADPPGEIAKGRLTALAGELARDVGEICRVVGRKETERKTGEMGGLLAELADAVQAWRELRVG